MIRWLFLVLIIVNLGIFAWGMQRELRPVEPGRGTDAGVPSLVLLSELETEGESMSLAPGHSDGQSPSAPPGILGLPLPEPDAETGSDPDPGENQVAPPLPDNGSGPDLGDNQDRSTFVEPGSDLDPGESPDAQVPALEEALPPAGAEPALEGAAAEPSPPEVLEADTRELDLGEPVGQEAPGDVTLASEPTCYSIGPFRKRDEADGLRALLEAGAVDAGVRPEEGREQKGYWVLIPPMASRAEAVAEVDRIKAKGITDVWRFNRGEMAHAISLGLFARRSQAETHQSDLERKGIGAEVQPRYVEGTEYYVDFGLLPGQELEPGLAERVSREYPEQSRKSIVCP